MFGLGLGEIILIVIVALLFIGPEKLPEAAKSISKGIRDIRKQTRELRDTIEEDTEFGGAIRDLQSALRGDELYTSAQARQKAAALKSAALKPAPGTESAAGAAAGAATSATSAVASAAGAASGVPAVGAPVAEPVPEPVIAASAGAVARGGVIEPAAAAAGSESPASAEQRPGEGAAGSTPTPGRAHG
jgi:sec-independent protein translocase protein TatB